MNIKYVATLRVNGKAEEVPTKIISESPSNVIAALSLMDMNNVPDIHKLLLCLFAFRKNYNADEFSISVEIETP